MKKYILSILILISAISCRQFKDVADVEAITNISATITVTPSSVNPGVPNPEKYQVAFINYEENYKLVKTTNSSGVIEVNDLIPGIYTVTATAEVNDKGFTYYYSGSQVNIPIIDSGKKLNISVDASKSGALIFKEIYFNGSVGYYFKDQFYEIYNNSDVVQYADGLCIGNILPVTATTETYIWEVPDGNPDDYVYLASIWQIPGGGKDYPVKPGESIVIAQLAQDHNAEGKNPGNSVNLSGSEYEAFIVNQTVNADNPNAINMNLKFDKGVFGPQWLVTVFGAAYVIFYPDGEIDKNTWVKPQGKNNQAKQIKRNLVVDAVELVNNATKIKQKRMPVNLDAGATFTGETYKGKSVSRKKKSVLPDGRIVYMDTNNSTNDFNINDKAMIRRDNVGIPSWNTWIVK